MDENKIIKIHSEETDTFSATSFHAENDMMFDIPEINSDKTYPEKYDLREYGLVSGIRDQGNFGTCWAFASLAAVETALIEKYPHIDLSELHLSYFTFSGNENLDPLNSSSFTDAGGHTSISTSTLAQGIGPVSEELLPYNCPVEEIDYSLKYNSEFNLTDSYLLNSYSKSKTYNDEAMNFSEYEIKEMLMQKNAVAVNFRYENSYNSNTFAQYYNSETTPNHAVTIVGWDDNFSKENFLTPPERDGAWLVKNSWGSEWGDNGYFWISYCDKSLTDTNCLNISSKNSYSSIYQHDTLIYSAAITADNENRHSSYMANIFTATKDESITSVGFYTTDNNAEYEITVYTGLRDENSPVSGEKSTTTYGTQTFAGYHVISLDNPVNIKEGEKFSVVVKLTNPVNMYPIPVEATVILCENKISMNVSDIAKDKLKSSSEAGESFISSNGTRWTDTKNIKIEHAYENISLLNTNVAYYIGNVCLKAFGDDTDKVYFSQDGGQIAYGTKTELSSVTKGDIYYTTDGSTPDENSILYTEPIEISEDMTIKATVIQDGKDGKVYSEQYTQAKAVLSSLTVNDKEMDTKNTNLSFTLEGTSDEITLFPIGTCDIEINGVKTISGHDSEKIQVHSGNNIIKIRCTQEGKIPTEYTLNVFKNYACIDYYLEVILFDEDITTVTAPDGYILNNEEKITKYLGQQLTVKTGEETTYLNVAPRLDLDKALENAVISYGTELITEIFYVSSKMVFSDSPDMKNAVSIDERKYPILSLNYFKIYPDFDSDLYFQVPASDNAPCSTIFHVNVPSRPHIDDDTISVEIIDDNSISFTIENAGEKKAEYKIEVERSYLIPYTTEITNSEKVKEDTTIISNLSPGETYILYIRFGNTSEDFNTYVKDIKIKMPGETKKCSFNYEQETIIYDAEKYIVESEDGTPINCYDTISKYIGSTLTFTERETGEKSEVSIPDRPAMDEISVDFINNRIINIFDDSIEYTRLKSNNIYYSLPVPSTNLCDSNGIIWLDSLFETGIRSRDTLFFRKKPTDTQFASDFMEFVVPDYERIDKNLLDIVKYTTDSITLQYHPGLEYAIRTSFRQEFAWQDSPVFNDLQPGKKYILAVRYKATHYKMHSQSTFNIIETVSDEYICGDLDKNENIDATDIVIMKKIVLGANHADAYQNICGDMNDDGKINVMDYRRIINSILEKTQ